MDGLAILRSSRGAPRRRSVRGSVVLAALVCALVAASCSSGSGSDGADPPATTSASTGDAAGWVAAIDPTGGGGSTIVTSADGAAWTETATLDDPITGLARGPQGWVAVGGRLPEVVVYTSPDLQTWERAASFDQGSVYDVAYGDGRFVAVGDYVGQVVAPSGLAFSTPMVHTSTDGTTWTTDDDPFAFERQPVGNRQPVLAVEHVEGLGFIAAAVHQDDQEGSGDPAFVTYVRSADGAAWAPTALAEGQDPALVGLGGERGGYSQTALAAGDGVLVHAAQPWVEPTNPDGLGDAPRADAPVLVYDPASSIETRECVLCNPAWTAVDGTPFEDDPISELAFGGGEYLAIVDGDGSATVYRSSDARTWEQAGSLDGTVGALAYGRLAGVEEAPATTAPPTTAPTTAAPTTAAPTTAAPTTAATTRPPATGGAGEAPTIRTDAASGSGCTPGPGPLPDGWWFGFTPAPIRAGTTIDFDLACYYYGAIAAQVAHDEDPVNHPDPTMIENDYYVSNRNTAVRSIPVAATADIRCIDMSTGAIGSAQQPTCEAAGSMFGPWIRVEGGVVTKVVEQFAP